MLRKKDYSKQLEKNVIIDSSVSIFKALGDETRLQILNALLNGALTVSEITNRTMVSQSCVSHQLKLLKELRIVKSERRGKCILYSLDDQHIIDIITITYAHVEERAGENDEEI